MNDYWTPSRNERFRKALSNAFDEASFDLLLADYFGRGFAAIAPVGLATPHESRLQQVIRTAKMEDWLFDLVAVAHERRLQNAALGGIAEELGLTASGPRLVNNSGQPLEALVNTHSRFVNVAEFLVKLAQIEGQVCWIDTGVGGGTGFLVGTDLVLTNHHVIKPILDGLASPAGVVCVFDYRVPLGNSNLAARQPTKVKLLSNEWLKDKRPPSRADLDANLSDASPEEADYALLRLEAEIGEMPVGGPTADQIVQKRGWICMNPATPALVAGSLIFLLQHPEGEPLQLTVGTVKQFNSTGTRVRYDANSKKGSSGSPCFDADLRLVALHHARDPADPPRWNQAIPFGCIDRLLRANPEVAALQGMKPCT